jgi:outer membrane protein assembly factor BamB
MQKLMSWCCLTSLVAGLALAGSALAADWLEWRGPQGTGQVPAAGNVPLTWSPTENIRWKVPLDGPGNSTPIVVGDLVVITHAPQDSKIRGIRAYDRNTGELRWKHEVEYAEKEPTHDTNPYCAASPVSDGERIVAWYGSAGVYCYDLAGKELWRRDLGKVEHIWGYGSSPLVYKNLVVLNYGPGLNAFVAALDKQTGSEVWRKEFPEQKSTKIGDYRGSWSTPVVLPAGVAGQNGDLLLLSLPDRLYAVDPQTGVDVWSCGGLTKNLVYTSPLIAGDVVVAMCGYTGPAIGVRAGGQGDVTETHRLWVHPQNPQRVGSGVVVGDYLYILNEPGIAWCLDPKTGEKKWEQRIGGAGSWSSMSLIGGKIYVPTTAGTTLVIDPSPEACKIVAENKLGELTRGSLAASGKQLFLRTYENLYCIESK